VDTLQAPNISSAEAVLLDTLRRSSGRLARREAVADVLRALPTALLVPVLVTLWRLVAPISQGAVLGVFAASVLGYVAYAGWRLTREASLARGAAELDREAALFDSLKTAEWFVRQPPDSPWVVRQVERAAAQAADLDVDRLVPVAAPRALWTRAALVVLALGLLNIAPPLALRALMTSTSEEHPTLTAEELEAIKDIKQLLEKANLAPETRRRLNEILDMLEANELRADETIEALNEAQELLSEADVRADGQETPTGEPQANQQQPSGARKPEGQQGKGDPSEADPDGEPEKDSDDARKSDDAREAASKELKKLQNNVAARQKNQEQRASNEQNDESKSEEAKDAENASQGGEKESQSQGDQESKKSAANASDPAASDKGGQGADPSSEGDAQGAPGEPTKLDVTLKRAALKTEVEPDILTPKELIEKDTKAGESKLQYQEVTTRTPYDQAEPLGTHEIPWMYRELVKTYFEAVGSRGTHDHD
jgi:hypothetical protein